MMLKVSKFGGSSLSDAVRFSRVAALIQSEPARRVVVVSAAGSRFPGDTKITDLLLLCHAHIVRGVSCFDLWQKICKRYLAIRNGCKIDFPIEKELSAIYAELNPSTPPDWLVSRGEYLSAKLMAAALGARFLDAADWLHFSADGSVDLSKVDPLQSSCEKGLTVTPGFYGAMPDGAIRTFSRGGSDITASLAAKALGADICENWTDVDGILSADPRLIPDAVTVPQLSYEQLGFLTGIGMQVLHESAVSPLREAGIPLVIRNTLCPENPGTRIDREPYSATAFALREEKEFALLGAICPEETANAIIHALRSANFTPENFGWTEGKLTLRLPPDCGKKALQMAYAAAL